MNTCLAPIEIGKAQVRLLANLVFRMYQDDLSLGRPRRREVK